MALAMHRHGRCDDDDDVYAGADTSGMEVVSAGSVTSFVRKLFQMVQGECDSIVGFVADGTAFEVKDPRRLEQDILPKYFRHSRFQSLVRQLNFYSFKKISKERSVWIYKHAFFRRDEPELLHALKRKTNQHGTPGPIGRVAIGGGADAEHLVAGTSPAVNRSLSRDAHDNKPRSRGAPMFLPRHGGPTSDFPPQHHTTHHQHSHHTSPPTFNSHPHQYHNTSGRTQTRPPQHPLSAARKSGGGSGRMYHASTSRSTGGGPSTGGGTVPSYGGQGPSSRGGSGAPGGWVGAGGRPVSSGGGQGGPGAEYERRNGGGGGGMAHHQGYNHGPAMGDTGGERGALGPHNGGNRGPATGGAAVSSDKEQALAIWGLSALCQVASSATEAPLVDDEARGRTIGGSRRLPNDRGRQQQKRHRGAGPASTAARGRRGWGMHDESSGGEDEEEDVTSAERDDSSSSVHRRSPSNSSCASSSRSSLVSSADSEHSHPRFGRRPSTAVDQGNDMATTSAAATRVVSQQQQQQQQHRPSGSGGVFCPTWDWGRAACEPAIRLPGSFVDRRYEEVDEQVGDGREMDDVEEESSKTEEEDMGEDQEEDADDDEEEAEARKYDKRAARVENTTEQAEVSSSLAETRITAPVATIPQPRDPKVDMEAETKVGLEGIGALFNQFCSGEVGGRKLDTNASTSVFLATVTNSGDSGLREMSVFCAGPAGKAPDEASPASLLRQVSQFLHSESAVAQDLRVYAAALDPAAVDVVVGRTSLGRQGEEQEQEQPLSTDGAKLLRVFCRYAACRLGRALEVASCAAGAGAGTEVETPPAGGGAEDVGDEEKAARQMLLRQSAVAQRITPRLDECRWKWWRAAVRFS